MLIRTFTAKNVDEAKREIQRQMGDQASILHTREIIAKGWRGWAGARSIEVTGIANDRQLQRYQDPSTASRWPESIDQALSVQGVDSETRQSWWRQSVQQDPNPLWHECESQCWEKIAGCVAAETTIASPWDRTPASYSKPDIIGFVGPSGSGKTTTIAKLAAQHFLTTGERLGLISLDHYRIGGQEHLARYADMLGCPFATARDRNSYLAAIDAMGSCRRILIDTPGVGLGEASRLSAFRKVWGEFSVTQLHLLLHAGYRAEFTRRTLAAFTPDALQAVVVTHLDEVNDGLAGFLNVVNQTHLPIRYLGTGQEVPEALIPATKKILLQRCVPTSHQKPIADSMHWPGVNHNLDRTTRSLSK